MPKVMTTSAKKNVLYLYIYINASDTNAVADCSTADIYI